MQPPPHQPYYQPELPRRRFPVVRVILFVALVLALIAGYFVFFAVKPPDGYMNTEDFGNQHVIRFLKWEETNGILNGYWSIAETNKQGKPDYGNGTITGTHSGSSIGLTFDAGTGTSETDTGTLENDILVLHAPRRDGLLDTLIYHGVTMDQYNAALNDFKAAYGNRH